MEKAMAPQLQCSCLENPMDGGAWWAAVHGVTKSHTRLSDFTFTFHFYALEKEMVTHSNVLAWRIPGMGSHKVGHDWSDLAAMRVKDLLFHLHDKLKDMGSLLTRTTFPTPGRNHTWNSRESDWQINRNGDTEKSNGGRELGGEGGWRRSVERKNRREGKILWKNGEGDEDDNECDSVFSPPVTQFIYTYNLSDYGRKVQT